MNLNKLQKIAEKGFITTSTNNLINWARTVHYTG